VIFSVADPAVDTGQPVEMQDDKMSVDGRKGAPQALVRAVQCGGSGFLDSRIS
jgi:hypothetical protein